MKQSIKIIDKLKIKLVRMMLPDFVEASAQMARSIVPELHETEGFYIDVVDLHQYIQAWPIVVRYTLRFENETDVTEL